MDPFVKFSNVQLNRNEDIILNNVNITINQGDFTYIVGRVGSGKSTFLKSIYVDIPIFKGDAQVLGYTLNKIKNNDICSLRRKIGIVFQDFQLLMDRSVGENLDFVLKATGWKNSLDIQDKIKEVLLQVGMSNKEYKMPHELSKGEQQRIVIARALLNSPKLIVADEPTGNFDLDTSFQIISLLKKISENGSSVIISTHNNYLVSKFPGNIFKCENMTITPVN